MKRSGTGVTMTALLASMLFSLSAYAASGGSTSGPVEDVYDRVKHGYADSNGVKIHYAQIGPEAAPLVVMIHGYPDFWYSWRHQMCVLSSSTSAASRQSSSVTTGAGASPGAWR